MRAAVRQQLFCNAVRPLAAMALVLGTGLFASGQDVQDIRLANGLTFRGKLTLLHSMSGTPIGKNEIGRLRNGKEEPPNIARIDTGWQRIYVSSRRLLQAPTTQPSKRYEKTIALPRSTGKKERITMPASTTNIEPFDEHGWRKVTVRTPKSEVRLVQAITKVAPDHVIVESVNTDWKFGMAFKSVPIESMSKLLRSEIKADDVVARFGLVQLYIEAEFYQQAFDELASIAKDFPDKKELIEKRQAELMNYFGIDILNRLKARKRSGQHQLAESYAKMLLTQPLTGSVLQDVQQYLRQYEDSRLSIDRAKSLLADWQSKLEDLDKEMELNPLRSEVNEELSMETLPRLDSFLKAEADKQYTPAERLGLAYTGWVLGAANAEPSLDLALKVWSTRQDVLDYLRSDDPSDHAKHMDRLLSSESVDPELIFNMIPQLPPLIDSEELEPGVPHQVETSGTEAVKYSVVLPAEYTHHHSYPLLIALRSRGLNTDETVAGWAGDANFADHGSQRGFIVVSPDYVDPNATEYTFGSPAHKAVLDCLIDARKRFAVDSDQVFLAGHGMGGDAAFDIGMSHPDEFAGVIPIGGKANNYCNYLWENAIHTSWYVVGSGYDQKGDRDSSSNFVFDKILQRMKFDFMVVEYLGRNGDGVRDEVPKFFDWMSQPTRVRKQMPKDFEMRTMRKADNRFFWVTGNTLPREITLPQPSGTNQKPMEFDASITAGLNLIRLGKSPTEKYTLRLMKELVDFDKPLTVRVGTRDVFKKIVKPDVQQMLEDLRTRGDRKRVPLAVISP